MPSRIALFFAGLITVAPATAQTTQGVISGRLVNSTTGRAIAGAIVTYASATSTSGGSSMTGADGYYSLPLLSPGTYRVRANAMLYQSQEVQELELAVASRLDLSFRLRPLSDVWESGQTNSVFLPGQRTIVTFFGPDVDSTRTGSFDANRGRRAPLETTVSDVIRSSDIADLPLAGRDVYTMLVTQPGVSSDGATARGLGLAVNGQRPSASNFLLDGLENNNYLITGPLVTVAPQAIQEYRISTNNYSAEYGRTAGYLANAITRSGANQFHGTAYLYLKNEILNGNGFQNNLAGIKRTPYKESQPGFWVGGPIRPDRLFFSSSYEFFRSRGLQPPQTFVFPNLPVFRNFAPEGRQSRTLLDSYAPPAVAGPGVIGSLDLRAPVSVNRHLAIERLDFNPDSKDRINGSLLLGRLGRPDFIWTPYKDFISPLTQNTWRLGGTHTHTFSADLLNEARIGYSHDDLHWDRPHPEIPTLVSSDGTLLPGSPAFYAYKNVNKSLELVDNVTISRGIHRITAGVGALFRSSDGYLTAGRDAQYRFTGVTTFIQDRPAFFRAPIQRSTMPVLRVPQYDREYRYQQYFGFVQDTVRVSSRLTANYGLRYESFGAPRNVGAVKDALVALGPGSTLAQQLATSKLTVPASGDQQLYGRDGNNWAVRAGASYDLTGSGRTLLRGSYGIFYDRPFDNLWQNLRNNDFIVPQVTLTATTTNYLGPVQGVLDTLVGRTLNANFPTVTLMDPNLRNGRVHSYFAGMQHRLKERLTVEVNALGSYGRRLITSDVVNRDFSTLAGRYNPALPDVSYRSGQGFSNYNALTAVLRYQSGRGMLHAAYTWSHAIDNQSEPLAGDFFNLTFTSISTTPPTSGRATFSRQFDPQADRANADFDQRHNLVMMYSYYLPGSHFALRDWSVSGLTAFRSGFPFSPLGPTDTAGAGQGYVLNNRPDLLNPSAALFANPGDVRGGKLLVNGAAFAPAAPSALGNLGRNPFAGPGFYNFDVALGRSFRVPHLGESTWLRFRADAFNLLNHANLGNPDTTLGSSTFGVAQYGRQGRASGFPAVSPLAESARQFQMSVRVEF
ncbi:MAG: carboxypeptidase regulatory-like domain-containing protein [Acidobacteriota bacterium]